MQIGKIPWEILKTLKGSNVVIIIVCAAFVLAGIFISGMLIKDKNRKISALNITIDTLKKEATKLAEAQKGLEDKLHQAESDKGVLQKRLTELTAEIKKVEQERNSFRTKITSFEEEKLQLSKRLNELTKARDELAKLKEDAEHSLAEYKASVSAKMLSPEQAELTRPRELAGSEGLLADVLRKNANLELEIVRLKDNLSRKEERLIESSKKIESLQYTISQMKDKKRQLEYSISDATQLAQALSLQLAREKKSHLVARDRMSEMESDRAKLMRKMDQLEMAKAHLETIKQKTDEPRLTGSSKDVELPPIVVRPASEKSAQERLTGRVIEVNETERFAIIDVGRVDGISTGMRFEAYRDGKNISLLEVIEQRDKFSACDIKNEVLPLMEGDIVMAVKD